MAAAHAHPACSDQNTILIAPFDATEHDMSPCESIREDDFASTGEIGIAHFVRAILKPLEAQGRGFSHSHEKVSHMATSQ